MFDTDGEPLIPLKLALYGDGGLYRDGFGMAEARRTFRIVRRRYSSAIATLFVRECEFNEVRKRLPKQFRA